MRPNKFIVCVLTKAHNFFGFDNVLSYFSTNFFGLALVYHFLQPQDFLLLIENLIAFFKGYK